MQTCSSVVVSCGLCLVFLWSEGMWPHLILIWNEDEVTMSTWTESWELWNISEAYLKNRNSMLQHENNAETTITSYRGDLRW